MREPQLDTVDLTKADTLLQIFPQPPVCTSNGTDWDGIFLVHNRQPAWEMPTNRLAQPILSINIGSSMKIERIIDGRLQREQFLNGNVAIYPANVDYRLCWERDAEFLLLGIDPVLLNLAADGMDLATAELMPILAMQDPLIQGMALALKGELESQQMSGKLYAEAIAQTLALHLLRNYSNHKPTIHLPTGGMPKHRLHQATDYINDHLEQELSLSNLAAVVQMSPFHFARLFKQSTGLAPHQFVIRCRVERAKELLLQGKLGIADIAVEVGFANQSHLTRHFKRIVGVTPRAVLDNRKIVQTPART